MLYYVILFNYERYIIDLIIVWLRLSTNRKKFQSDSNDSPNYLYQILYSYIDNRQKLQTITY